MTTPVIIKKDVFLYCALAMCLVCVSSVNLKAQSSEDFKMVLFESSSPSIDFNSLSDILQEAYFLRNNNSISQSDVSSLMARSPSNQGVWIDIRNGLSNSQKRQLVGLLPSDMQSLVELDRYLKFAISKTQI